MKRFKVDYTNEHFGISHVLISAKSREDAIAQTHEKYNDYMIINVIEV